MQDWWLVLICVHTNQAFSMCPLVLLSGVKLLNLTSLCLSDTSSAGQRFLKRQILLVVVLPLVQPEPGLLSYQTRRFGFQGGNNHVFLHQLTRTLPVGESTQMVNKKIHNFILKAFPSSNTVGAVRAAWLLYKSRPSHKNSTVSPLW